MIAASRDAPEAISVESVVDGQPLGFPFYGLIALCSALMACEAYDLGSLAFVAPTLMKAWALPSPAMGVVISAAAIGMLIGNLVLGEIGDRYGRRPVIVISTLAFAVFTLVAGFTRSPLELASVRFLAALGFGGVTPNVIALVNEMVPSRLRSTSIGIIFSGFLVGGIAAGLVSAQLVPVFGWQAIFWIGGSASLLCAIGVQVALPESLALLAAWPGRQDDARRLAAKVRPDLVLGPRQMIVLATQKTETIGVKALFVEALRWPTFWVWTMYLTCALTVFTLGSWLPTIAVREGFGHAVASYATAAMFAGGSVGSVIGGVVTDRFRFVGIAAIALLGAAAIAALGIADTAWALLALCGVVGVAMFGSQSNLHGIVGSVYPAKVRATGAGWGAGASKVGAVIAPMLSGGLLPILTASEIFLLTSLPMIVMAASALCMSALERERRRLAV